MSNELKRIRQLLYDAEKNIEFAQGCQAPEKISALIDTALQKMETACMDNSAVRGANTSCYPV